MKFDLSDDQQLLRTTTRDFLAKDAPLEKSKRIMEHDPRGFEAPQWRQLAEAYETISRGEALPLVSASLPLPSRASSTPSALFVSSTSP